MALSIEICRKPNDNGLLIRTLGRYAMGVAIETLTFLHSQPGTTVQQSGWQNGFGLDVAVWMPIIQENLKAELQTDGEEIVIRRVNGPITDYEALILSIVEFLIEPGTGRFITQ